VKSFCEKIILFLPPFAYTAIVEAGTESWRRQLGLAVLALFFGLSVPFLLCVDERKAKAQAMATMDMRRRGASFRANSTSPNNEPPSTPKITPSSSPSSSAHSSAAVDPNTAALNNDVATALAPLESSTMVVVSSKDETSVGGDGDDA
jgi:hypothetical protein